MHESLLFTALMVGFLGGVHCLGMCSGVVGTLSFNLRPEVQLSLWRMFLYQLAYNLGRVTSYALIGALFGWLGHTVTSLATFLPAQQALQIFAGAFMLALGLYVAGVWNGVVVVERLGSFIWKRLQPVVAKMTSVRTIPQAWLYGMVWGWLPCGLVYSMVIMAISTGGTLQGAAVMIAFGLGTMPNLLLMGSFAFFFTRLSRNQRVRRVAGFLIMLMGAWQIWLAVSVHVS